MENDDRIRRLTSDANEAMQKFSININQIRTTEDRDTNSYKRKVSREIKTVSNAIRKWSEIVRDNESELASDSTKSTHFRQFDQNSNIAEENCEIDGCQHENADPPCECYRFVHVEDFASDLISEVINTSVLLLNTCPDLGLQIIEDHYTDYREYDPDEFEWPLIGGFTVPIGLDAIEQFVATQWHWQEDWLYCVTHISTHRDECSDYHEYTVDFSIPTKEYPIPQATATVYFTIEVSRIKPRCCLVDVTYQFETSRTIHSPGKLPFREEWLFNIVDAKIKFFKTLTF